MLTGSVAELNKIIVGGRGSVVLRILMGVKKPKADIRGWFNKSLKKL